MTSEAAHPAPAAAIESTPAQRAAHRQKPHTVGPLSLSILLHGAMLIAAAFVVWRVATPAQEPVSAASVVIETPELRTGERAGAQAPVLPLPTRPEPAAAPGTVELRFDALPEDAPTLDGLASATAPTLIAPPTLAGAAEALSGPQISGDSTHLGEVAFAGLGASGARSIVYVVDGSGPMVTALPLVIAEVERSVARLKPTQSFGVVVFHRTRAGKGPESFSPRLVRATPGAKERLAGWLRTIEPGGQSNPLDGLRLAIAMKPQAVFLLSRGIERSAGGVWELGMSRTLRELDQLNPLTRESGQRRTIIKTVQFLDEDPTGIMQAIGERHGTDPSAAAAPESVDKGYTVIRSERDLQKAPAPGAPLRP